jgi:hypothetical protein
MTEFLTSRNGVFAATVAVLGVVATIVALVRPTLQARRDRSDSKAQVRLTAPNVGELSPHARWREVSLMAVNSGGGTAVLISLHIVVVSREPSPTTRTTSPGAGITVHRHRVDLRANKDEYDVRSTAFGKNEEPLHLGSKEQEAFVIKLVSDEPIQYHLRIEARWFDSSDPDVIQTTSAEFEADFPQDQRDS